jgi:putative tryptophan/tyrosine transport system ATP-binding protein
MIVLQKINVNFGKSTAAFRIALNNLDLQIDEGEFVTVIGSNGAGKSTLLNTIAGEVIPDSGQIRIDDEVVTKLCTNQRAQHVARVFQDPMAGTCANLTIAENLALAFKRGRDRVLKSAVNTEARALFKKILQPLNLGLENRLDTLMAMLSGGQRQAVSLLMATLSPLKILLLDEHTAALDPKTSKFVMELTNRIVKEKGLTTLMVTHSLSQALQYGTRTIMLHEGQLIYDVKGDVRANLTPQDLMRQFGETVDNDRLLLNT